MGINVKDPPYNAVGDGTADETQIILDAIAACPEEQAVFLPAGSYRTTGTLVISKPIVLRGEGPDVTHIIQDSGNDAINGKKGKFAAELVPADASWPD